MTSILTKTHGHFFIDGLDGLSRMLRDDIPDDDPNYCWRMRMIHRISELESQYKSTLQQCQLLVSENHDLKIRLATVELRLEKASVAFTELRKKVSDE